MATGLCSKCKTNITSDNSCSSVFLKQAGYCRLCAKTRIGLGHCHRCKIVLSESNSNPSTLALGRGSCRSCDKKEYKANASRYIERSTQWAKKNRLRSNEIKRKSWRQTSWYRKKRYGITEEEFELQIKKQNGLCSVCGILMDGNAKTRSRVPNQDHNHTTGKLRDVLCSNCNLLLGHCLEKEEILLSAVRYLRKHADGSSIQTVCDDAQASLAVS